MPVWASGRALVNHDDTLTMPAGTVGAGSGSAGTASVAISTDGSAAMAAGMTSLASQAAVALINNKGDIGKTLEQLGSEQSIKGLLTTMVTAGALDKLEGFASFYGADFYGLPRNTGTITLKRESWTPPESFAFGEADLKPLRSGEALPWRVV